MIDLRELKSNPPPALTPILPYQESDPALLAPSLLREWVEQQRQSVGLPAEEITAAILLGSQGGRLIEATATACPRLGQLLVLEPDVRMVRTLVTHPLTLRPELDLEACHLGDVINPGPGYSLSAYIDIASFLVAYSQSPRRALVVQDPTLETRDAEHHISLAAPLHDLTAGHSAELLNQLEATEQLEHVLADPAQPPGEWLFLQWSHYLFEQAQYYDALKFFLLYAERFGRTDLAPKIAACWQQLDCAERAAEWWQRASELGVGSASQRKTAQRRAQQAQSERQRCYERNLNHLRQHYPEVADRVAGAARAHVEVVQLRDWPWRLQNATPESPFQRDDYRVQVEIDGDRLLERTAPPNPRPLHTALKEVDDTKNAHACVGTAKSIGHLYNMRANSLTSPVPNWTQAVYVVEQDASGLRAAMEHEDYTPLLKPGAVRLFAGPDAERALLDTLERNPNLPIPRLHAGVSEALARGLDEVEQRRGKAAVQGLIDLQRCYPPGFAAEVLRVLETDARPLRVWFWTSIHTTVLQYVAKDLAAGFEELGHQTATLVERDANEAIDLSVMTRHLQTFRPDVVVLLDHIRPEYGHVFPPNLPVITWILDELPQLRNAELIRQLGPHDLAFAASTGLCEEFRQLGYPFVEHVPFAVNPRTYHAGGEAATRERVAYATHLTFPSSPACDPGFMEWLEPQLRERERLPVGRDEAAALADDAARRRGVQVPDGQRDGLYYQTMLLVRHVERIQVADGMLEAGIPMDLYGRGWADIPRFRPHARGVVAPGEPLRRMYREHKVVLHINKQFNLHPRVFEALSSGGFVLARSDGELFDNLPGELASQFEIGRELCLFKDTADMIALIERAFEDPAWRDRISRAGRARILRSHTYARRAGQMLNELIGTLRSQRVALAAA